MPNNSAGEDMSIPSIEEVRTKVLQVFGRRPCFWQYKVSSGLLRKEKDVVCISGTGSGKTLTFWIPLLFRKSGVQIVITPLNLLGNQNKQQLGRVGIKAVAINGDTASHELFREIEDMQHGAIVISPEQAFKKDGPFIKLLRKSEFTDRLISIVWDEAHCIQAWGTFRQDYKLAGRLRHIIPHSIPYLLPSATFPTDVRNSVVKTLGINPSKIELIQRSNDRPNIYLTVRKIRHALSSFKDLNFLLRCRKADGQLYKFLVFFDNIEDSIKAAEALQSMLPPGSRYKVATFNSDNTAMFRQYATDALKEGKLYGLYCTDSFGLGVDISDIDIVIQWRPTCSLDALWQRFGRAARDFTRVGLAILFADSKYFDDERAKAAEKAEAKQRSAEQKAKLREEEKTKRLQGQADSPRVPLSPSKRQRRGSTLSSPTASPSKRRRVDKENTYTSSPATRLPQAFPDVLDQSASLPGPSHHATSIPQAYLPSERLTSTVSTSRAALPSTDNNGTRPIPKTVHYDKLRVSFKLRAKKKPEEDLRGKPKTSDEDLDPEMDSFINAASREYNCYRIPVMSFYENDRIVLDDQECSTGGCPRCSVPASVVCCSLCTPQHSLFTMLVSPDSYQSSDASEKEPSSRASHVPTKYEMNATDLKFRTALHEFRKQQTIATYSEAHLYNAGAGAIMGDDILQRIIDCARAHKLVTLDALKKETKWNRVDELDDRVLELVAHFYPHTNPFSAGPLQRLPGVEDSPSSTATRSVTPRRCSACRQPGHTKANRNCPQYAVSHAGTPTQSRSSSPMPNRHPTQADTSENPPENDIWASMIATPSYRRNAQVLTLDEIISSRAASASSGPSSNS